MNIRKPDSKRCCSSESNGAPEEEVGGAIVPKVHREVNSSRLSNLDIFIQVVRVPTSRGTRGTAMEIGGSKSRRA